MPSRPATVSVAAAVVDQIKGPVVNSGEDALLTSTSREGLSGPHRHTPRVLVLYVGGTIGMKKNKEGSLEPCAGYLSEEIRTMPELRTSTEIAPFDIIEYEKLLDSSEMGSEDYLRIAGDITAHYNEYDGFLIAHGTDTMHYTACALSFLLYNLAKPVILTGAMVPLAEPYNDARRNLVVSLMLASNPLICEVCIFFNDALFRGCRSHKVRHTFDAFASPNYPPLGVMDALQFHLRKSLLLPPPTGSLAVLSNLCGRIMTFAVNPDTDFDVIFEVLKASLPAPPAKDGAAAAVVGPVGAEDSAAGSVPLVNGILLELMGIGSKDSSMSKRLRQIAYVAEKREILVCVTMQEPVGCLSRRERRRMSEISPSLVYVRDMTVSAAEMKMVYLFGKGLTLAQVKQLMPLNLRGEVSSLAETKL